MSLKYRFRTGKYKHKTIKEVKTIDFGYLKDISRGKIEIKLTQTVKDFIDKMTKGKYELSTHLIDEVIQLYKDGYRRTEILDIYIEKGYSSDYITAVLDKAGQKITADFESEKSYLIGLHIKRYDENYNSHMANAEMLIGPKMKWKRVDHYVLAMNSLVAKETLLGLHTKKYNIQLNNFMNKDRGDLALQGYGFENLTTEELIELLALMKVARVEEDGMQEIELFNESMMQASKAIEEIEEVIEDIEHEEISPLSSVTHTDDYHEKIVEKRERQGNTIDTVEEKIRDSNKSAFELMLKKKMKDA